MVTSSSIWPLGQPYPPLTQTQQAEIVGPQMAGGMHWTPADVDRYWEFLSHNPDNYLSGSRSRDIVHRSARLIGKDQPVLVYASGPGFLLNELTRAGFAVTGTDGTHLATGPTYDALVKSNRVFGGIFMVDLIERLYDHDLSDALTCAHRLLAKDGRLVVITPFAANLDVEMVYSAGANLAFHRLQHVRSWTAASLTEALRSNGYRIDQAEAINFRSNKAMQNPIARLAASAWAAFKRPSSLMVVARK
jgi:SAM-dependent methyltransferase